MEQHDQERSWKSDPRLHHMDAKKIALLASFADELAAAPEAQRMNLFLDLHRKMRQSNLVFSSEERDLPVDRKSKLSVVELFGWNPLQEAIPSNVVDLCVNCHRRSPRRSAVCK